MVENMNVAAKRPIKNIVFVDDDHFFLEAISEILESKGFTVHRARDGMEGLALIREVKPDCILLDVVLPKLDGGEVCASVRQDVSLRQIPIIVFSSLGPKDYTFFPNLSADAYVAKAPLAGASQNILEAISHFEKPGPKSTKGLFFGYDDVQSRRIVDELLMERRHLRAILEVLAPGALVLNPDGHIVMANPSACEMLGKRGILLIGELFSSLLQLRDQDKMKKFLAELRQPDLPTEFRTAFQFGTKVLAARLAAIFEDKTCTGFVVVLEGEVSTTAQGG